MGKVPYLFNCSVFSLQIAALSVALFRALNLTTRYLNKNIGQI